VITRVTLAQRRTERNIILGAAALLYAVSLTLPPEEEPPPPPLPPPPTRQWAVPAPLAEGIDYSDEVRPYREPLEYYDEH
jgi:hypothetical protein